MIERELMIGNLVMHNDKVVEFDSHKAWHITELQPIPLTNDWIIKLGFKRLTGEDVVIPELRHRYPPRPDDEVHVYRLDRSTPEGFEYTLSANYGGVNNEIFGYILLVKIIKDTCPHPEILIHNVHQLQNLIYSLTGQELTIKND